MILVGLGEAGKNIAELFKPHKKTYKILIFDEDTGIDAQDSVEDYDKHPVKIKTQKSTQYHDVWPSFNG